MPICSAKTDRNYMMSFKHTFSAWKPTGHTLHGRRDRMIFEILCFSVHFWFKAKRMRSSFFITARVQRIQFKILYSMSFYYAKPNKKTFQRCLFILFFYNLCVSCPGCSMFMPSWLHTHSPTHTHTHRPNYTWWPYIKYRRINTLQRNTRNIYKNEERKNWTSRNGNVKLLPRQKSLTRTYVRRQPELTLTCT